MKNKRKNTLGKRIVTAMLCVFVVTVSINPRYASYIYANIYANSTEIQGVFNETLTEDKTSSVIDLRIDETENKTIESIILPDQTKLTKSDFKYDDNNKLLVEYTATENKKLEYVVEYTDKQQEVNATTEQSSSQADEIPEVKKETLSYEVKDIIAPKEPTLKIDAKDITYKIGEEIDFRKDITIKDEKDKDITDSLNFNIVDFNQLNKDQIGNYLIKYETQCDKTGEVFKFERIIDIVKNYEVKNIDEKNKSSMAKTSIELSSNNSELKNPNDFLIGSKGQIEFNVLVKYQTPEGDVDRKCVVTIPEYFRITRAPSLSQVSSASKIDVVGNTITITFDDRVVVDTVFEIGIEQNWTALYDAASVNDLTKIFLVQGISAGGTVENKFELFAKEFESNIYDFDVKKSYTYQDFPKAQFIGGKYRSKVIFKYKRIAYSKADASMKVVLPRNIGDLSMVDTIQNVSYVLVNGQKESLNAIWEAGETTFSVFNSGRALENTEYEFHIYYDGQFYSNAYFESNASVKTYFNGKLNDVGNIIVDTRFDNSIPISVDKTEGKTYTIGTSFTGSGYPNTDICLPTINLNLPSYYVLKDITISYKIPYGIELQYLSNYFGKQKSLQYIKYYTNLGKEIKATINNNSFLKVVESIESNEYINKVDLYFENITSESLLKEHDVFGGRIRRYNTDGNAVEEGTKYIIEMSISSSDSNIKNSSFLHEETMNLKTKDSLSLTRQQNCGDKWVEKVPGDRDVELASIRAYSFYKDSKVYDNASFVFEGKEMLSLIDYVYINYGRGYGSVINPAIKNLEIIYSTNKRKEVVRDFSDGKGGYVSLLNLNLNTDEYVTAFRLSAKEFDPYMYMGNSTDALISLRTKEIKKQLPFNGVNVEGYYNFYTTFKADNSKIQKYGNTTPTIKVSKAENIMDGTANKNYQNGNVNIYKYTDRSIDMNWTNPKYPSFEKGMLGLTLSSVDKINTAFEYQNLLIDISSDPRVIASLTGFNMDTDFSSRLIGGELLIETSQRKNIIIPITSGAKIDFDLEENEYVKSIKVKADKYIPCPKNNKGYGFDNILFYGNISKLKYTDYDFLGTDYKSYKVIYTMTGSNFDEEFVSDGTTAKLSALNKKGVGFSKLSSDFGQLNIDCSNQYQGGQISVDLNLANALISNGGLDIRDKDDMIIDPIIYVEVDKNYSYITDSLKGLIKNGITPSVSFVKDKTIDGNSVLKIKYNGTMSLHDLFINESNSIQNMSAKFMVDPNAQPQEKSMPVKNVYLDLNDSVKEQVGYSQSIELIDAVKDNNKVQDDLTRYLLKAKYSARPTLKILEANEMGIGNYALINDVLGQDIIGHDNDKYSQELSISSNYDRATNDWIVYIPIPKEGKVIKYKKVENGVTNIIESDPSAFSMNLKNSIAIPNLPENATISYTMDEDPVYALDGSEVGNYTDNIGDWSKVTMVKIKIPSLEARKKLFPIIDYEVSSSKKTIGKQTAYGNVYFNMKLEGSDNYIYNEKVGAITNPISFSLIDFNVTGKVWEDKNNPSNSIYDLMDTGKSNIEVIATDKDGNEFTDKTKNDGTYTIVIPSHGETEIKVILPNDLTAIPKQKYIFVENGKGTSITSSVVDKVIGETTIEFIHDDIHNVNAGLWPERAVAVNPGDIVIVKGATMPVPAAAFPNYSVISYQNTADTSIATVSNDGKVTGVELGETTATVTIPDGNGGDGVVTATYNIKVVPEGVPTATSDPITIFQNGTYDATSGIVILDSDKKPISAFDSTKVTINTASVDVTTPGRYPITYTINDGYNEVTVTRYIYVHGSIQLVVPNDVTKKVGESVTALDGASATYIHINEDGTQTEKNVPVTTPNATIISDVASRISVPLESTVTVDGATDTAIGSYTVLFNEKVILTTVKDNVTVKSGATLDEIKAAIQASASMMTPDGNTDLTNSIDWSILNDFNTSVAGNTVTGKIFVLDPDTGEKVEKEIIVTVSQNVVINAPKEVNLVVGDSFDPFANVTITDGDGNEVSLTDEMINSNNVEVDSDSKTTKRGVYEVEYEYTDKYGNTKRAKTTVNVHGQLLFDATRKDFLQNDSVADINSMDTNKNLAYYIDAIGNKNLAVFKTMTDASSSTIGKSPQNLVYTHPVNGNDTTFNRAIYVHGHVSVQVPNTYTVKVNTEINTLKNVTATYKFVDDDGTIVDKTTTVTSTLGNKTTSAVPTEKILPVEAHVEVVAGLNSNATNSYTVIFNGLPIIIAANDSIEVRVGATFDEIKNAINASASVQYGDEVNLTDLTVQINWDEVKAIDTSIKEKTYTVKINVMDRDGATAEKTLQIKVLNGIIINLPSVDKVVEDKFDPKENVTIIDSQGKPVDLNDITIDDSKVDMSKPGNYDVVYTYTDSLGNTETKTNTIRVHGKLQFEGLDRIDLIEKVGAYVVDTAKAFYMNNEGIKVYVDGVYDKAILDQSVVGKNELIYSAVHPINNGRENSVKQNVFIHGEIIFHKPTDILTDKVNTILDPKTGVTATFDFVNDDGTITTKGVPVTSKDVTSNTVGYVESTISAKVKIVEGLTNSKDDTVEVGFDDLPYINAATTISYDGVIPSKADIISKMLASAGMKQANGVVIDLTDKIDYSDVNRVDLDKNGNYQITLTVTDLDGFTTNTVVKVIVNIPTIKPIEPNIPIPPNNPTYPVVPNIPGNPQTPVIPDVPTPPLTPVEKDTAAAVSRDIPLSEAKKNGISNDFVKAYITASTEKRGIVDFEILSHNVLSKVGEYEVTIRLDDGTVLNVKLSVIDDGTIDVDQPGYGHEKDCIIHWFILLLLTGYSIYSIAAILKRRKDNKDLERALEETEENESNTEGVERDEN